MTIIKNAPRRSQVQVEPDPDRRDAFYVCASRTEYSGAGGVVVTITDTIVNIVIKSLIGYQDPTSAGATCVHLGI